MEQNKNIMGANNKGAAVMTTMKDIVSLISIVAFVASVGVLSESMRMLM